MINECQALAVWSQAQITDPAGGFIQYLTDGIFNAALAFYDMHNRQCFAIGTPVGCLDVVKYIAGSVSSDRKLSQCTDVAKAVFADAKTAQHRHLARRGNRQDFCLGKSKIT